jgi:hypothetical protein
MAQVTLGQAAKLTALGKTTLARAIKRGALSASRKDDGGYLIEVSELERVYPIRGSLEKPTPPPAAADIELQIQVAALRATLEQMQERLTAAQRQAVEAKESERRWYTAHERLLTALPSPSPAHPATPETLPATRRWRWFRSVA